MIMNREGDSGKLVNIATSSSAEKETEVQLTIAGASAEKTPKLLTPKETILEEERTVAIKEEGSTKHYYVYVKGAGDRRCHRGRHGGKRQHGSRDWR